MVGELVRLLGMTMHRVMAALATEERDAQQTEPAAEARYTAE